MTVYHAGDTEWLEQQYWPWTNPQPIIENWAQMSADYLARAQVERDISYGPSMGERLDLLRPSAASVPVLIFIHGGYWGGLDKDTYTFALEPLVSAGALVATVNYTLCPEVTLDTLVDQVRAACAWVWRHASDYGGDPARLHVAGHSAGGHLAAMMAATAWPHFEEGLPRDMFKSAVVVSGLFDLDPIRSTSMNDDLGMDAEIARRNSPQFMTPTTTLPVSVVVGGTESDEFLRQSREFAAAWRTSAGVIEYVEMPDLDHFEVVEAMIKPNNLLTATILRHLEL